MCRKGNPQSALRGSRAKGEGQHAEEVRGGMRATRPTPPPQYRAVPRCPHRGELQATRASHGVPAHHSVLLRGQARRPPRRDQPRHPARCGPRATLPARTLAAHHTPRLVGQQRPPDDKHVREDL